MLYAENGVELKCIEFFVGSIPHDFLKSRQAFAGDVMFNTPIARYLDNALVRRCFRGVILGNAATDFFEVGSMNIELLLDSSAAR